MKKILLFLLVVTLSTVFVACGQSTTGSIANNLQNDTQRLLSAVNELDTLNGEEILVQDISPMATASNAYSNNQNGSSLSKNYSLISNGYNNQTGYSTGQTGYNARQTGYNARQTRSNTQNNTGNGIYNSATQSARQGAYMQDLNPNQTSNVYNTDRINRVNTNYVTNNDNNTYRANQIRGQYGNTINNNNTYSTNQVRGQYDNTINNNNNTSTNRSGAFRYIPMENENSNNYNLYGNNYKSGSNGNVTKIQKMYNLTSDVFYANTILNECKNALRVEVQKCNTLTQNLKDNNVKLTDDQKTALNTHLAQIGTIIKRLNNTKGSVSRVVSKVKPLRVNYSENMDTLNAEYTKLLNLLSQQLTECQAGLDSVTACNNILSSQGENAGQMNYNASQNNNSTYNNEGYNGSYNGTNYNSTYDGNNYNGRRVALNNNNNNSYMNNPARPSLVTPNNNMIANNNQNTTTNNAQITAQTPNNTRRTPTTTTIPQVNVANGTQNELSALRNQIYRQEQQLMALRQEIERLKTNYNSGVANNTTMTTLNTPSTSVENNPNANIAIPGTITNINNTQDRTNNTDTANNMNSANITDTNNMNNMNNTTYTDNLNNLNNQNDVNNNNMNNQNDVNNNNMNNQNDVNNMNNSTNGAITQNETPTEQYRYNA